MGKLRRKGAAAVISSIATIHARHAVPLAEELLKELGAIRDGRSLGDVMRDVRRTMLGRGLPMALCLTAYGDADWVLKR